MFTHSSILAWKIPRSEDPAGLQSMESQSVGHDADGTHSFWRLSNIALCICTTSSLSIPLLMDTEVAFMSGLL